MPAIDPTDQEPASDSFPRPGSPSLPESRFDVEPTDGSPVDPIFRTAVYDPDLPIRGRYLSVQLRVDGDRVYGNSEPPKNNQFNSWGEQKDIDLHAENGRLAGLRYEDKRRYERLRCYEGL